MNLGTTVAELQRRITSREFAEWKAYDEVEPFGDNRADFRAGTIAAATVNMWRRRQDLTSPGDFMVDFPEVAAKESEPDRVTPADRAAERAFVEAMGAKRVAKK